MLYELLKLTILFFVIFNPPVSLAIFSAATSMFDDNDKKRVKHLSILVATLLSIIFLVFGNSILSVFSTSIDEFRVAGGIILGILGLKMALGIPVAKFDSSRDNNARAIASIIGTPLLTGPAAITAIIISAQDFGMGLTAIALAIVLSITAVLFHYSDKVMHIFNETAVQVSTTILGLVTLSWGVGFITYGLSAIL
jgi:multiple antibiotic resistance protein